MKKVFNYERVQTFSEDGEANKPLSPIDAYGYSEINEETGEVFKTSRNWFQAVPQVGTPFFAETAGEPRLVNVMHARDLKARAMALIGNKDLSALYGAGDVADDDDDALPLLYDDNDSEADDFNVAMSSTPYACDDKGVANYESAIARNEEELRELRDFMSKKDDPLFQQFAALSPEDQAKILESLAKSPEAVPSPDPVE